MPIGSSDFGMGITFTLEDNFSTPAKKIQNSFSKMDSSITKGIQKVNSKISAVRSQIGNVAVGVGIALALTAPFAIAVKKSAELSDALADVTKTTGIAGAQLQDLRNDIESIDTRTSVFGLLEIAKAGGAMGVAKNDIAGFTEAVDKLNVALGDQFTSPELLARELTKLRNVLRDIQTDNIDQDLLHIGNALNFMGANSAALERNISSMVTRMAGLGQELGATTPELFGLATAMDELGVNVEVAGSNVPLIMQKMATDYQKFAKAIGVNATQFKSLVNEDIVGALTFFAERLKQQEPTATGMAAALDEIGLNGARVSQVFLKLGSNVELVNRRIGESEAALKGTSSIMDEFNAKNTTFAAVMDKARKRFDIFMTRIGDALAPIILRIAAALEKVMQVLSDFVSTGVGKVVTGMVAMAAAGLGLISILSPLISALTHLGISVTAALGPIGIIIAAIAALIAIVVTVKRAMDDFKTFMEGGVAVEKGFAGFLQKLGGVATAIIEIFRNATSEGFSMSVKMRDALDKLGILDFVISLGTWIVRIKEFFRGVFDVLKFAFDAWKEVFVALFDVFLEIVDALGLFEGSMQKGVGSMEAWRNIGRAMAVFMTGTMIPIFKTMAALIRAVGAAFVFMINFIKFNFGLAKDIVLDFVDIFTNLPDFFLNLGSLIVDSLLAGITGNWDKLKESLLGLISALPGGSFILDALGIGGGEGGAEGRVALANDGTEAAGGVSNIGRAQARGRAREVSTEPTVIDKSTKEVKEVVIPIQIGSEKITKVVNLENDFQDSRD